MNGSAPPPAPSELFRLDARVAIVTGASAGLGARFARVLASAGANVILTARRAERLEALSQELGGAPWIAGDITDDEHVVRVVELAEARYGYF